MGQPRLVSARYQILAEKKASFPAEQPLKCGAVALGLWIISVSWVSPAY